VSDVRSKLAPALATQVSIRCSSLFCALLAGVLSLAACDREEPAPAEPKSEELTEKKPAVDQKIASAMAAAEKNARSEAAAPSGQAAPPPDGILGADAAARELSPGSPAELVLGGNGSEPRLQLGSEHLAPGAGPTGRLTISYRSGGSVMPTIEFEAKQKIAVAGNPTQPASVPTSAAPGAAPASSNSGAAGSVGPLALRFVLGGARPADNQPGRLPENARAEIAKLNGSTVELVAQPNGAIMAQSRKVAGDNLDLEPIVTSASESLGAVLLPYPEVPVGVGAFWMVKSRETLSGAPVIAYRMVKLTELSPAQAKLSVETRRYLIEPNLPIAGLPPHQVRRFESEGEPCASSPARCFPSRPKPATASWLWCRRATVQTRRFRSAPRSAPRCAFSAERRR
jgi:hypothetical protein